MWLFFFFLCKGKSSGPRKTRAEGKWEIPGAKNKLTTKGGDGSVDWLDENALMCDLSRRMECEQRAQRYGDAGMLARKWDF